VTLIFKTCNTAFDAISRRPMLVVRLHLLLLQLSEKVGNLCRHPSFFFLHLFCGRKLRTSGHYI